MVGTCRKCRQLITTVGFCRHDAFGDEAVAVGVEMMRLVREHYQKSHPAEVWLAAEATGQLAALFPFLAGVEVDLKQRAVLLVTYTALKAQLFNLSFGGPHGEFGMPPAAPADGLYHSQLVSEPVGIAGGLALLDELDGIVESGQSVTGDLLRRMRARESANLRASMGEGAMVQLN